MKRINKNYSLSPLEIEALELLRQQLFDQVIDNEPFHPYADQFDGSDALHYAIWVSLNYCSLYAESDQVRHECKDLLDDFYTYEKKGRR